MAVRKWAISASADGAFVGELVAGATLGWHIECPPYTGTGILMIESKFSIDVDQLGVPVEMYLIIGVDNSSEDDYPMYPYVGVSHPESTEIVTVRKQIRI